MMYKAGTAPRDPPGEQSALPVVLLFPGQGSQHPRMASGLYMHDQVFTSALDEVFDLLGADGDRVRADWLADDPVISIDHVTRSQILLFAIDYALGRLVLSWNVRPAAMLGHSVGELAAAVLAGVFGLPDAVRLLWDRVNRLAGAPPGGMLAVAASVDDLQPYLRGDVVVGAVNAPRQTVIAGPQDPLNDAAERLSSDGFVLRSVPASAAFHSPCLAALAAESVPLIAATPIFAPRIPMYSGYTGSLLSATEAVDPEFWAGQPAAPVLFWTALDTLLTTGNVLLCEAGPGQALTTVARRHRSVASSRSAVVPLLPARPGPGAHDRRSVTAAAARITARAPWPLDLVSRVPRDSLQEHDYLRTGT